MLGSFDIMGLTFCVDDPGEFVVEHSIINPDTGCVIRTVNRAFPNTHRDDPRAEAWRAQYMSNGGSE